MDIVGENQENTIINGQQSGYPIFQILGRFNVTISNLTLTNASSAIFNYGTLYTNNITFTNNTGLIGGAVWNKQGGNLILNGSTFTNNNANEGGAIGNNGQMMVDNCTFLNNSAIYGGAIYSKGDTVTVDDSKFTNNSATDDFAYGGGAIYSYNDISLTIDNSTFTNNTATNGGAIGSTAHNFSVFNCTFTNNTATDGGAIWNVENDWSVVNSSFTNNIAGEDGGAIWGANTQWSVRSSSFLNNSAGGYGGAIYDSNGIGNAMFNRFVGNSRTDIYSTYTDVTAEDNWWGTNFLGTDPLNSTRTNFNVTNWIVLSITANPTPIYKGNKSTVKADLLYDNTGNLLNGSIPDGIDVQFSSDTIGKVSPRGNTITNGVVSTTFTGLAQGISVILAIVDDQTVKTNITINKAPVSPNLNLKITASQVKTNIGEKFTVTYDLNNNGADNASNVSIILPLPTNFSVISITGDGNWMYSTANHTITWTLNNVPVGDPYLYVTGTTKTPGAYAFGSSLSPETLNIISEVPTIINNAQNSNPNTGEASLNAATDKIPMQHTGLPIAGLIVAILSVLGGTIMSRRR